MAVLPIRMRVSVQNMRENHGQLPRPQDGRLVPHRHADSPPLHIQDFQGLVKMEGIDHIAGRKHPDIRLLVLIPGMHDPPRLPCATNGPNSLRFCPVFYHFPCYNASKDHIG